MADATTPKKSPSAASRYLFVLIFGLVLGIIATVMIMRAWQERQDPYPGALMTIMAKQSAALRQAQEQNRCTPADVLQPLQTLRALTNDIDAAFPDLKGDAQFQKHASDLRSTLNAALQAPPSTCQDLAKLTQTIGQTCSGCHQVFKP
jgi:cytochrome c556